MYHIAPTEFTKSKTIYIQQIITIYFLSTSGISARFFIFAFGEWHEIRKVKSVVYHIAPKNTSKTPSIKAKI